MNITKQEAMDKIENLIEEIENLKQFIEQDGVKGKLRIGQWVLNSNTIINTNNYAFKITSNKELQTFGNRKHLTLKDFIINLMPDDAAGYAVDSTGELYFYTQKPEEVNTVFSVEYICKFNDISFKILTPETLEMAKDWQNSWTPRPEEDE